MARILIIDDEANIRAVVASILESAGHTTIEAANGDEGIRKYRDTPADVVITDILMPEKEGLQTIMELRAFAPQARIIAMSGGGRIKEADFLDAAAKLGANEVLKKPFRIAQLCDAVNACLGANS